MRLMIKNDKRKLNGKINTLMQKTISISKRIIIKRNKEKSNQRKEKKINSNLVGHSNLFRCLLHVVGTLDMALIFDH